MGTRGSKPVQNTSLYKIQTNYIQDNYNHKITNYHKKVPKRALGKILKGTNKITKKE